MDYVEYEAGVRSDNFYHRAKNNLVEVLMNQVCNRKTKLKILNIGAGTGDELKILNKYGDVYVIDISKESLSLIDPRLCAKKTLADARSLPFKNGFFDVVLSLDVFEHIKEDAKVAMEICRVLKKGGFLIWTVPAFQILFSNWDAALKHKRRYNKKAILRLLSKFDIVKLTYWNSILFIPIAIRRLIKKWVRTDDPQSRALGDYLFSHLPSPLNSLCYGVLNFDNLLIKWNVPIPIGLSIAGYCRK